MSQPNQPMDDQIKNTLQQHEFDFDAGAWEAMNEKLDDRQNTVWRKGFNWMGLSLLLIGLTLSALVLWNVFAVNNTKSKISQHTEMETNINAEQNARKDANSSKTPSTISKQSSEQQSTQDRQNANKTNANSTNIKHARKDNNQLEPVIGSPSSEANPSESNFQTANTVRPNISTSTDRKTQFPNTNYTQTNTDLERSNDLISSNAPDSSTEIQNASPTTKKNTFTKVNESPLAMKTIVETPKTKGTSTSILGQKKEGSISGILSKLPKKTLGEILGDQVVPAIKKSSSNLERIKIKKPFRWYLGAEAGVHFYSFQNNFITELPLNLNTANDPSGTNLNTERESGGRRFYLEAKAGIHLRKNTALEMGFSYLPLFYQYGYNYLNDLNFSSFEEVEQKIHQFSIPLRGQIKIGEDLRLGFGGGVSLRFLDKKYTADYIPPVNGEEIYEATKDIYQPVVGFWETGIGYDRGLWTLDLKYQTYFTPSFKKIEYSGGEFRGDNFERNFTVAFGRRLQKYHDPIQVAKSTINKTQRIRRKDPFNWGIGIATGRDYYRAGQTVDGVGVDFNYDYSIREITSPLKLGLWADKVVFPDIDVKVQGEIWAQKYDLKYQLDGRNATFFGYADTNFVKGHLAISRLEIPLTVHYSFPNRIRLVAGLGIEFNFVKPISESFYSQYRGYSNFIRDLPKIYKKNNFIWDLGVGYDWGQFSFDLRYRAPFNQVSPIFNSNNSPYGIGANGKEQVEVSLKYAFKRK